MRLRRAALQIELLVSRRRVACRGAGAAGGGALGYRALAVTDRNSLAGVVRAHIAAKEVGLPLVIGAEITPTDAPPVVLWATDRAAYGRLCRLLTRGRRRAPKGECALTLEDVAEFAEGLLAGVVPGELASASGENRADFRIDGFSRTSSEIPRSLKRARLDAIQRSCVSRHFRRPLLPARRVASRRGRSGAAGSSCKQLAREVRLPLVAAGDVHYHVPGRMVLYDVLTAIRHGTTVAAAEGKFLFPNAERHLRSLDEIRAIFAAAPDAVERTCEIADRCRFSLDELRYEYPTSLRPRARRRWSISRSSPGKGAAERYPAGLPRQSPRS